MAGGRGYVVRAAKAGSGREEVDKVYPYTLRGLTDALDDARFQSYADRPQLVIVVAEGERKVIRKFENGHEVPETT